MRRALTLLLLLTLPFGTLATGYTKGKKNKNPRLQAARQASNKAKRANRPKKRRSANKKRNYAKNRAHRRGNSHAKKRRANRNRNHAKNHRNNKKRLHTRKSNRSRSYARQRNQRQRIQRRQQRNVSHYLADRGHHHWERNQHNYRRRARHFHDDNDAEDLIFTILGSAAVGALAGEFTSGDYRTHRLPAGRVGRTRLDRQNSVDYLIRRFRGDAAYHDAPYYDDRYGRTHYRTPHFYQGNRRVVYYPSRRAIPPVLLASNRLNRVEVSPYTKSSYQLSNSETAPHYAETLPDAYQDTNAYAVSYAVETDTLVSRDDILFDQGETTLADAYSYDIIVDLAEAMQSEELKEEQFVIEGHASAEGGYGNNLELSQERAERIARDLVDMGVDPNRLLPVGYGEAEAENPARAAEYLRALDRRVMVFTVADEEQEVAQN
ncbi:MAG: hypothetical protein CMO55_26580 [Verrucomicrobiales bacterium]|nr:hypothetical protein [Verrucomicrobiales bacterium]